MKCIDSEIKVPWGHVAVQLWGEETNEAVLMFHGILDNVGTFERLIPLLPKPFYYICVDLPGHGKSSHWSAHSILNSLDNLLVYKAVVDYFNRGKYIIVGHSYGAQLGFIFTQLYPEHVTKLVMLEAVYLFPYQTGNLKEVLRKTHKSYFHTMKKLSTNRPPNYTYEEALDKLINNRENGELTQDSAEPLLKRLMIPGENGKIQFGTDQRLKFFFNPPFDFRYMTDFIKKSPVLCPVLIILGSDAVAQQVYFERFMQFLQTYKNIRIEIVKGFHDVHNVNPERVAPLMTAFLHRQKSKV